MHYSTYQENKIKMKLANEYAANNAHILKIWQVQTQRNNHIRRLNNIYSQRNPLVDNRMNHSWAILHQHNKVADSQRQKKIAMQQLAKNNQKLRERLIDISLPTVPYAKEEAETMSTNRKDMVSNQIQDNCIQSIKLKNKEIIKDNLKRIAQENNKLYVKLINIKSQVMDKLKIQERHLQIDNLKELVSKKSPTKRKHLKSFFKQKNIQIDTTVLPTRSPSYHMHENKELEQS